MKNGRLHYVLICSTYMCFYPRVHCIDCTVCVVCQHLLSCVCPAFDLRADGDGILIRAVMTAEILYCRPPPPYYSPLTFTAPQLEKLYPPCISHASTPAHTGTKTQDTCAHARTHVHHFRANSSLLHPILSELTLCSS